MTIEAQGVVVKDHEVVGYKDAGQTESPFAVLATLKPGVSVSTVEVRPVAAEVVAVPEVAEPERSREEDIALAAEISALLGTGVEAGVSAEGQNRHHHKSDAKTSKSHGERKKPHDKGNKHRPPQFGGGIRKIELVQVEEAAPPAPPSGSMRLSKLLHFPNVAALTYAAIEAAEKGAALDVVVWSKSSSGFDHVRIVVVLESKREKWAHLEITEATGKFENLAQYIGQQILYGEVMGHKDSIPPGRALRTAALNAVLVEADQHLREAEAKRKAQFPSKNKGSRK